MTEKMDDFFEHQVPLKEIIFYPVLHEYVQFAVHLHLRHLLYQQDGGKFGNHRDPSRRRELPPDDGSLRLFGYYSFCFRRAARRMGHPAQRGANAQLHRQIRGAFHDGECPEYPVGSGTGYDSLYRVFPAPLGDRLPLLHRVFRRKDARLAPHGRPYLLGLRESLERGARKDITLPIIPDELFITAQQAQQMTTPELRHYIKRQLQRGSGNVKPFEVEYHKRWAMPLGAFIMTLLGVTMSSRRQRGGMGKNLGLGIVLTAGYILFSTVSTTFSVNNVMSPLMAAWLPNLVFLAISIPLYIRASR